tara:strand:- start:1787 stop:2452 length:666 start_codon:yes stop_codon:yes gene_type:complete
LEGEALTERGGTDAKAGKNARMAVILFSVVAAMVGLAFASVPLYRVFSQITGYGGTTRVSDSLPDQISDRVIKVQFNADINARLPWEFKTLQRQILTRVGAPQVAYFRARSLAERTTTGTAVFNVTPERVGQYFNKVRCFCFGEQTLEAGQEAEMEVAYYLDPAILDDPALDTITIITLSYTFYRDLDEWNAEQAEKDTQTSGVEWGKDDNRLADASRLSH